MERFESTWGGRMIGLIQLLALCGGASVTRANPCDIYAAGGTPCIAAHSTVRALYRAYAGNLYQVRRSSDNTMKDIPAVAAGSVANSSVQDQFCTGTTCVITVLYDQSGHGNFMEYQGAGSSVTGSAAPAVATNERFDMDGSKVYSLYIKPGNTYWRDGHLTGVPTGSQPEGMYMVTSGKHYNAGCCFDYGNSETTRKADAAGAMDAIYFGSSCWFAGSSYKCNTGSGPWVQADLEWGLFASNSSTTWNPKEVSFTNPFVTAMLKNNGTNRMAIKGANAQAGNLTTIWDGALPYSKMVKQGAIVLGSGGDCCRVGGGVNQSEGTFYEGAIVSGYPTDAVDSAIQAEIAAAGYGRTTSSTLFERRHGPRERIARTLQDRIAIDEGPAEVSVYAVAGDLLARGTFARGTTVDLRRDLGVPEGVHVVRIREMAR